MASTDQPKENGAKATETTGPKTPGGRATETKSETRLADGVDTLNERIVDFPKVKTS